MINDPLLDWLLENGNLVLILSYIFAKELFPRISVLFSKYLDHNQTSDKHLATIQLEKARDTNRREDQYTELLKEVVSSNVQLQEVVQSMSAFTAECSRTLHAMNTRQELLLHMANQIILQRDPETKKEP